MGVRASSLPILSRVFWWVWLVCLWFIVNELEIDKSKVAKILMCVCVRMGHGGYGHMLCNVAIFLCEIVTCTSYGATLWDSVGGYVVYFPGGSTPIVLINSYSVNKIIIFLT